MVVILSVRRRTHAARIHPAHIVRLSTNQRASLSITEERHNEIRANNCAGGAHAVRTLRMDRRRTYEWLLPQAMQLVVSTLEGDGP